MEKSYELNGSEILVSTFVDPTEGRRWYMGKPFAVALGYKFPVRTLRLTVKKNNIKILGDFEPSIRSIVNDYRGRRFVTAAGLIDLLRYSNNENKIQIYQLLCDRIFVECNDTSADGIQLIPVKQRNFVFDTNYQLCTYTIADSFDNLWFLADSFIIILELASSHNTHNTIMDMVSEENRRSLDDLLGMNIVVHDPNTIDSTFEAVTNVNKIDLRATSVFINQAGIFELIGASGMSKAKEFTVWMENEVLPTLCACEECAEQRDPPTEGTPQMEAIREETTSDTADDTTPIQSSSSTDTSDTDMVNLAEMLSVIREEARQQAMASYDEKFAAQQRAHEQALAAQQREHEQALAACNEKFAALQREYQQMLAAYDEKFAAKQREHQQALAIQLLEYQQDLSAFSDRYQHRLDLVEANYQQEKAQLQMTIQTLRAQLSSSSTRLGFDGQIARDQLRERVRRSGKRVLSDTTSQSKEKRARFLPDD